MERNSIWVGGVPATYATKAERPWKDCLSDTVTLTPQSEVGYTGLDLRFILPTFAPKGHPLDVDNLCEPVFSVLIGKLGWFQGKRPNLRWWHATKAEGISYGVQITAIKAVMYDTEDGLGKPIFDSVYTGDLPSKATDTQLPIWISRLKTNPIKKDSRFVVRLLFGNEKINIGDIATGKVKSLIDCLYPIIGGISGNPEDWRIDSLIVHKGISTLQHDSVRISIWRTGCDSV
ncbi:hypothetical protein [Desulfosporosinus sp.]|uniref:hypothetical protein n=1 Tax=Desulfosporosinus sp. TaxID=157907 RepID=UPI0025BA6637|nr:hypothetical protein [Desulfosporosinus sp.]MBC2726966.1 hypothetical protein [Desulfosporosinus sp.]